MKMIFYSVHELNKILEEIYESEKDIIHCEVEFSEKLDTDVVVLYREKKTPHAEITIEDVFPKISQYLDETVTSYDVFEVGDFGEGFAFYY
ncbi:hypothetical protein SMD22_00440 (plasmid) [Brevibacillus halotolerans]|nr:hypothetical protein SMD22_00440 [Brevibacillus halotolerans]